MSSTTRFLAALAVGLLPVTLLAQGFNDRVRVEVRTQSTQDRKTVKGATAGTVTQNKTLTISLYGKAKNPETRTGTWTAYGRDLKDKDLTVLDSGTFTIDLATGTQTIETNQLSTTSTAAHTVVSGKGGSGKSSSGKVNAKKIPGEGVKYAGYSVQVTDGAVVLGEASDPVGIAQWANK